MRAERPDGSGANGSFVSPLGDLELENFILRVGMPRRRSRRWSSNQVEEARRVGGRLFGALMREDVLLTYVDARARAEAQHRGLRITLTLTEAPALMRLPWEYLYQRPGFLSQSRETLLVRGLDVRTRPAEQVSLPLRVLGMISAPTGEEPLDGDAERAKLEKALEPLVAEEVVDLQWVDRGTLSALELALARFAPVHVLHYIGHSGYDDQFGAGALAFEADDRSVWPVTGADLCALLGDQRSLQLVVLNSCEGARTSLVDPFSGVASALLECRIPAVVAMQFEITDGAAITFGGRLYESLAANAPIDEAIVDTRKAIFAAGHEAEFGTPVLFAVPGRTKIFDVSVPRAAVLEPEAEKPEPEPDDVEHRFSARLVLELAEALRPGASGAARVEVTAEKPTGARLGSTDVRAIVITSEHLTVQGPQTHPLQLTAEARAQARFDFRVAPTASARDPLLITVLLVHEGRPVASVHRKLTLELLEEELAARPEVVVETRALAPDLTIHVVSSGDDRMCTVTSPLLDELTIPSSESWRLPAPFGPLVAQLLHDITSRHGSAAQRRAALIAAGVELYRATPPLFQRALWALLDAGSPLRSIFVVTDEPEFPWELVIPHCVMPGGDSERRAALGVEFVVGRWHRQGASPRQQLPLTDPLVIAPIYDEALIGAEAEAEMVMATLGGRRLAPATVRSLDSAVRDSPAGLIHFAGRADRAGSTTMLHLDAGQRLSETQLLGLAGLESGLRRDRPLVFLNASGGTSRHVVASLVDLGASAVIAPAWSVSDKVAAAVASDFYTALTADPQRPFADILREIRARAYEGDEPEDSWAAYTFFGDPLAARAL